MASDDDPAAIAAARQNARTAGVEQLIRFAACDFAETPLPDRPGIVIMNPEYGERLGETAALEPLYATFTEGFGCADLRAAAALLEQIG